MKGFAIRRAAAWSSGSGTARILLVLLLSASWGCAAAKPTVGVRPALGTTYSEQQAGLLAADQARLDAQCPLGRPRLKRAEDFGITHVVARDGYALEASEKDRIPIWVCERITRYQVTGPLTGERVKFRADPLLPVEARAVDKDYTGSGYDRGHQAPLANQRRSQRLRDETFFLSNAVPQNSRLNRQAWAALEERVRVGRSARHYLLDHRSALLGSAGRRPVDRARLRRIRVDRQGRERSDAPVQDRHWTQARGRRLGIGRVRISQQAV